MSEKDKSQSAGSNTNIRVFLRVRPTTRAFPGFSFRDDDDIVDFHIDREHVDSGQGQLVNNSKQNHKFKFDGLFGMDATQEEVFKTVAGPVIKDALNGLNGTIFAYGQTGSGKTYTITGGSEKYVDRGLIPRTISEIFEHIRRDGQNSHSVFVSYLEIYNNYGYDLLSRDEQAQKLESLPKVSLREDEDGNMHLKNLSVNVAASEEDALNLLFLGDTNRVVAETPMNDASTRSHCIFIIWIQSSEHGSDVVRRSKVHLVDLAGSERVSKTGVDGKLLAEAKYINTSLHFLEQVIVALNERSTGGRMHIPYRNSMMTSVLRDSLGGNCKTVMVGTIAVEPTNIDEAISTCRFAQRVACIKNSAIVNEELDPQLMIKRLKREILELKDELKQYRGDDEDDADPDSELSLEKVEKCKKQVLEFCEDTQIANFIVGGGRKKQLECFRQFRQLALNGGGVGAAGGLNATSGAGASSSSSAGGTTSSNKNTAALQQQIKQLELEVAQRDQEIGILVSIVNRGGGNGAAGDGSAASSRGGGASGTSASSSTKADHSPSASSVASRSTSATTQGMLSSSALNTSVAASDVTSIAGGGSAASASSSSSYAPHSRGVPGKNASSSSSSAPVPQGREAAELLLDRAKAFEVFRKSVRRNESFEENKELLRELYVNAKALGEEANTARQRAAQCKTEIQKLRLGRAMEDGEEEKGVDGEQSGAVSSGKEKAPDPQEQHLLSQLEHDKKIYSDNTNTLRQVKHDIERIQQVLEQNKKRLQKDFESWFVSLRKEATASLTEIAKEQVESENGGAVTSHAGGGHHHQTHVYDPVNQQQVKLTGNADVDKEVQGFYKALGKMK